MSLFYKTTVLFFLFYFCLNFEETFAYVPSVTPGGLPMKWRRPKIDFLGNPVNTSGISPEDFFQSVVASLSRWKYASYEQVGFDYWQGNDLGIFSTDSQRDGKSTIYFSSNAPSHIPRLPSNILGMTQVWFNSDTGQILEADIALNDIDYVFTMNPMDTSGYGNSNESKKPGPNHVFIQNVITHEIGHAFGLSHSGNLQATMLYTESPEQAHLSCDDQAGIRATYPSTNRSSRGSIEGRVEDAQGNPLFGVHLVAVSETHGTTLSTTLSQLRGEFKIQGLPAGRYYIYAEPFYAGASALPTYYSKLDYKICPEKKPFPRTFLKDKLSGLLQPISVDPDQTSTAGTISILCQPMVEALPSIVRDSSSSLEIPTLLNEADQTEGGTGFVGRFEKLPDTQLFKLKSVSGNLKIHALSYSLYSPIHLSLSLLNINGTPVEQAVADPVYKGRSGFKDLDSSVEAQNLPLGDYWLKISADSLSFRNYPAPQSRDRIPFFVLTAHWNTQRPRSPRPEENARCALLENFPNYQSPPGSPPANGSPQPGVCGGIAQNNSISTFRTEQSFSGFAIAGWFLPWILPIGAYPLRRKWLPLAEKADARYAQ